MSASLGRRGFVALVATLTAFLGLLPVSAQAAENAEQVIVQALPGHESQARAAVTNAGGKINGDLSLIDGFTATMPATTAQALEGQSGIQYVTADEPVHMNGSFLGDTLGGVLGGTTNALGSLLGNETQPAGAATQPADSSAVEPAVPAAQPQPEATSSNSVYNQEIGADSAKASGVDGSGVTVALIDTGVANVGDVASNLVPVKTPAGGTKACVDFSGENTCNDSYGHGTFIAGLIAGNGNASNGQYTGVAPGAKILSVKIGGRDGSSSVGKILFAIQWVIQHKDQYGVKVMNLSLGTDSTQSYKLDPLNFAVERAWNKGISVVVSAGNRGSDARTISKPADDPLVITTGAVDDMQTAATSDDTLPNFTSRGPTASDGLTKPDITAPGAHLVSLVSPGSAVEEHYPSDLGDTYRKGSGTSQSAGVVSGSVALLLSAHPEMTPNEVKYALTHTATKVASENPNDVGAGIIDIGDAVANPPVGEANQDVALGTGRGSILGSQGSVRVVAKNGGAVVGLITGLLGPKGSDSTDPSGSSWYGTSWYGTSWYGTSWYGSSWYGTSWYGTSWYGTSWYGSSWYGVWG